jgi:hypothetical protein
VCGIKEFKHTVRAGLNMGPGAGDVDCDAMAGYILASDRAAGVLVGLDNHFGDALLRDAIERSREYRTVVIKNSVLPEAFFDGERLAACTCSST